MKNNVALFLLHQHKPFSTIRQEDNQSHNSYNGTLIITTEGLDILYQDILRLHWKLGNIGSEANPSSDDS